MEQLRQAVADALERGLVRRTALLAKSKQNKRLASAMKNLR